MSRITKSSDKLIKLIEESEGCILKAYKCPAGIWTIGYGNTFYEDGRRISPTDSISKIRAIELLTNSLKQYESDVDNMTRDDINQNQFDALVDFAYNCGSANLRKSTLLKKINTDPNDPTIALEFMKWTKAGGVTLKGLVKRREKEAQLYFSK